MTLITVYRNNEGDKVTIHECNTCGTYYSVCPPVGVHEQEAWDDCLAPDCPSYDLKRDLD